MNIKSCLNEPQNISTVLGLNIKLVKFCHPELKILLETLLNNTEAIIVTGTWLFENDQFTKLDINSYQLIQTKTRKIDEAKLRWCCNQFQRRHRVLFNQK